MTGKAELTLRSDSTELCRLVEFAGDFARLHCLADEERTRLLIILEELFTNVVKYGYADAGEPGTVDIALAVHAGTLTIDFRDDGARFDPLAHSAPDLELEAECRPIGGLGLTIVRALADEARYRHDGTRNHLFLVRRILLFDPGSSAG